MSRPFVVHAVRSDGFAGVERYMCDVGGELAGRGWRVLLIGGDPALMRPAADTDVELVRAASTVDVMRALVGSGRPDLVHVHMSAAELAGVTTKAVHRAPLVATRHFDRPRGQGSRTGAVTRAAARALDAEISISRFVAEQTGPGSVVVPNGVANCPARTSVEPYVLTLQRLETEKDPLTAVRAWAHSGLADRGWRLRMAGRGSQREAVVAEVARLGMSGSVDLLGFVPDPYPLLEAAACLLATAPTEPFGLSVVEAMARAVPVVAASGGAHAETLGESTGLFPPHDYVAAGDLLRRLADFPAQASEEAGRLRARQQDLFSLTAHVDGLERVYASLHR